MTRTTEELKRENALMKGYLAKFDALRGAVQTIVEGHPAQGFEYQPKEVTPVEFQRKVLSHVYNTLLRALQVLNGSVPDPQRNTLSVPALPNKSALVLYFDSDDSREHFRERCVEQFPDIREVRPV